MAREYKKLVVWQRAMDLTVNVYKTTALFPDCEKYGMVSQINRACVSIACNISEGAGRNSYKEFSHFLSIARASSNELETLIMLAERTGYIDEKTVSVYQEKIDEIQRMLSDLKRSNDLLYNTGKN
jgi:four helix bundle protein